MNNSRIKAHFPLWHYLNQPLFSPTTKAVLNPFRFWQSYKLQLLEQCWSRDPIQMMERCWMKDMPSEYSHDPSSHES